VDAGFWNGEKLFGIFEKIDVNNSGYYSVSAQPPHLKISQETRYP